MPCDFSPDLTLCTKAHLSGVAVAHSQEPPSCPCRSEPPDVATGQDLPANHGGGFAPLANPRSCPRPCPRPRPRAGGIARLRQGRHCLQHAARLRAQLRQVDHLVLVDVEDRLPLMTCLRSKRDTRRINLIYRRWDGMLPLDTTFFRVFAKGTAGWKAHASSIVWRNSYLSGIALASCCICFAFAQVRPKLMKQHEQNRLPTLQALQMTQRLASKQFSQGTICIHYLTSEVRQI